MSNTIQSHCYSGHPRQFQHYSGDLIEAAGNLVNKLASVFSRPAHVRYEHESLPRVSVYFSTLTGTGSRGFTATNLEDKVYWVHGSSLFSVPEVLAAFDDSPPEHTWIQWADQTKKVLDSAKSATRPLVTTTPAAANWRVERIAELQAAFGFTVQDLAAVLKITRPRLYKWMDAANDIKLQEANRARLAEIEHIAKEWNLRSEAPLSSVSKEPLPRGETVFSLMCLPTLDSAAVIEAFAYLSAKLKAKSVSKSAKLRNAGFTRRPSMRSLPSDE